MEEEEKSKGGTIAENMIEAGIGSFLYFKYLNDPAMKLFRTYKDISNFVKSVKDFNLGIKDYLENSEIILQGIGDTGESLKENLAPDTMKRIDTIIINLYNKLGLVKHDYNEAIEHNEQTKEYHKILREMIEAKTDLKDYSNQLETLLQNPEQIKKDQIEEILQITEQASYKITDLHTSIRAIGETNSATYEMLDNAQRTMAEVKHEAGKYINTKDYTQYAEVGIPIVGALAGYLVVKNVSNKVKRVYNKIKSIADAARGKK